MEMDKQDVIIYANSSKPTKGFQGFSVSIAHIGAQCGTEKSF